MDELRHRRCLAKLLAPTTQLIIRNYSWIITFIFPVSCHCPSRCCGHSDSEEPRLVAQTPDPPASLIGHPWLLSVTVTDWKDEWSTHLNLNFPEPPIPHSLPFPLAPSPFLFSFPSFLLSSFPQSSTFHRDKCSNNLSNNLTPCFLLKNPLITG